MNQHRSIASPGGTTASQPTTPFSEPWLARVRNAIGTVNGRPTLMTGFSISQSERTRIEGMIKQRRDRVATGRDDRKAIIVTLGKLLAAFPTQAQSDGSAEQRVEAYLEALGGIPAWAVDEARKLIITGMAAECAGSWAPTPPQLVAVCRRILKPDMDIIRDLERVLDAADNTEPDKGERERVIDGFAGLRNKLAASNERGKPVITPEMARARFEEMCKAAGVSPDSIRDQPEHMQKLSFTIPNG